MNPDAIEAVAILVALYLLLWAEVSSACGGPSTPQPPPVEIPTHLGL